MWGWDESERDELWISAQLSWFSSAGSALLRRARLVGGLDQPRVVVVIWRWWARACVRVRVRVCVKRADLTPAHTYVRASIANLSGLTDFPFSFVRSLVCSFPCLAVVRTTFLIVGGSPSPLPSKCRPARPRPARGLGVRAGRTWCQAWYFPALPRAGLGWGRPLRALGTAARVITWCL